MTFWIAGAGLAMSTVGMIGGSQTAAAGARAGIAQSKAQLATMKANQHNENAKAGFANFMTAFNNNRQLKQFGKATEALNSNVARSKDTNTANKLENSLRQAEQRGAMAASAGFGGSAGASHDAIESSMRLRDARVNQNIKDGEAQLNYVAAQQHLGLIDNGLMGLDMTVNGGGVEASVVVPAVTGGTNYAAAIGNSGIIENAAKLASSWPGGGATPSSNLTGGGLGLRPGAGGYGLYTPSASTSFFNLGNTASVNYSLY